MELEQQQKLNMHDFIQQDEEDKEESLSLCDLPNETNTPKHSQRSSNSELFQFFIDPEDNMCAAEDVILHGKLIPFNQKHQQQQTMSNIQETKRILRKRSESLSEIKSVSRTNSAAIMRNSRSLDHRKLRRTSSSSVVQPEIKRNSSVQSVNGNSAKKNVRPKWFVLMFRMVKFPTEMELNDIKNRQNRMNPTSFLAPVENGPFDYRSSSSSSSSSCNSTSSSSSKGYSWRLLKALSCKDHASVAATTPFYMSNV